MTDRHTRIALVGEAWGQEEVNQRTSFVGPSGYTLNKMLEDAGIRRSDCYITDVFNLKPEPTNDIDNLCGPKADGIPGRQPIRAGKYIRAEFAPEIERLEAELAAIRPNIVVALGGAAAWAIVGSSTISKVRGTIATGIHGLKALSTYHPAAVNRDWSLRPVTVLDLEKAERESHFPEVRRPKRNVIIEPSLKDMEDFYGQYYGRQICGVDELNFSSEKSLGERASPTVEWPTTSIDIETSGDFITCIGFAPNTTNAIVVPFVVGGRPWRSYWTADGEEKLAWDWVARVLSHPAPKVFQNGLYDLHFLWRRYGLTVKNCADDTMLLHHALQPESPKGLDFLGSVYTNEASWKLMRKHGKTTIKKGE